MNKQEAMLEINSLITKHQITNSDYYNSMLKNPIALMLGCERCNEYGNNGCGTYYFPHIDTPENSCDQTWKTISDFKEK